MVFFVCIDNLFINMIAIAYVEHLSDSARVVYLAGGEKKVSSEGGHLLATTLTADGSPLNFTPLGSLLVNFGAVADLSFNEAGDCSIQFLTGHPLTLPAEEARKLQVLLAGSAEETAPVSQKRTRF